VNRFQCDIKSEQGRDQNCFSLLFVADFIVLSPYLLYLSLRTRSALHIAVLLWERMEDKPLLTQMQ